MRKGTAQRIGWGLIGILLGAGSPAFGFAVSDVQFWVGSGAHQAVLVIDWNDGISPESRAWGYRWDGSATGEDMLRAVLAADPRLFAKFTAPQAFGTSIIGVGYDEDYDGFALSDATSFTNGLAISSFSDTAAATDSDDHYKEGWYSAGYWAYYGSASNPYAGGTWVYPGAGMSTRTLADGDWDGWSFAAAPTWDGGTPSIPAAALLPEPAAALLALVGGFALLARRRGS